MSSSAVIVWVDKKGDDWSKNIGIYLHDGGSYNYVSAILRYCKLKEYRAPNECCYGYARFCQVIANFFMNGLGVGIDKVENCFRPLAGIMIFNASVYRLKRGLSILMFPSPYGDYDF